MDDLSIKSSEFASLGKTQNIKQKEIFAVKVNMEILFSEGVDKSLTLRNRAYYYYAIYLLSDNKAIAVNMLTFD